VPSLRALRLAQGRLREAIQRFVVTRYKIEKLPAVYILASQRNGTLYVGVTSNLVKRVWEHKNDQVDGFSRRYGVHMLVYYEILDAINAAITREKQIKAGSMAKKLRLIESMNPEWNHLYAGIV
jgi:putative endonuclease